MQGMVVQVKMRMVRQVNFYLPYPISPRLTVCKVTECKARYCEMTDKEHACEAS